MSLWSFRGEPVYFSWLSYSPPSSQTICPMQAVTNSCLLVICNFFPDFFFLLFLKMHLNMLKLWNTLLLNKAGLVIDIEFRCVWKFLCSSLSWVKCRYVLHCTSIVTALFVLPFDIFLTVVDSSQVSLRDPLRCGVGDEELREIIGAAVCMLLSNKLFFLICYLVRFCVQKANHYHAI